jgi:hypothetical protein
MDPRKRYQPAPKVVEPQIISTSSIDNQDFHQDSLDRKMKFPCPIAKEVPLLKPT